jgi:hypothetical protein
MAWEPYSCKREKSIHKNLQRNPNYTPLCTTQPPSQLQKGAMTYTRENYWKSSKQSHTGDHISSGQKNHSQSILTTPIYSIGNPPENSTDAWQDGMQNYKTTTSSLNMYLERPTLQPTPYLDHLAQTKAKKTTKT